MEYVKINIEKINFNSDSVFFDVGGYIGGAYEELINKHNLNAFIFEPVKSYFNTLCEKHKNNEKVRVLNYGLFDKNDEQEIAILADDTSLYKEVSKECSKEKIILRDVKDVIEELKIKKINLMKINIEGAEYPLLEHMVEQNLVSICDCLVIQFHRFYPNALELRKKIQDKLSKTHEQFYNSEFIWEGWIKK